MKEKKLHIKHGLYIAIILIVISFITNVTGTYDNPFVSYLIYPIIIAGIIIFCWQYAKQNNKNKSFSNIFSHGFKTACVTALIMIVWNLFSSTVIFKDNTEKMMNERKNEMVLQGQDEVFVEKQQQFAKDNYFLLTISSTLLFYAITGVVGSILGASLAPKNKN